MGSYGSSLVDGNDSDVSGRYIQWKCDFTSTGKYTPNIDWLSFNYVMPIATSVSP